MKKYTHIILIPIVLLSFIAHAQTDSVWKQSPIINIGGFLDVFYIFDFNKPKTQNRQPFLYNHNRHNEFNLNLGYIQVALQHPKYRANISLQTGTYAQDNYANEPGLLKNIFEAHVGLSLHKKNNLWLDAGILPSHIGFESAVSIDNWTMTRSMLAENSPYYLTGAKLTYHPNDKLEIAGLLINGWQRIQKLQGNSLPSMGTQIIYYPIKNITLNWSTFIGTDDPDVTRRIRYFNNMYGKFQITEKFGFLAGFDIGIQQKIKNSSEYDAWFSPVIIGQFTINEKWKTAIRAEYYQDKTGIIIPTGTKNGFNTKGFSMNVDYSPISYIACRIEGRYMHSQDKIFETNTASSNTNFMLGTSLAIKFLDAIKK